MKRFVIGFLSVFLLGNMTLSAQESRDEVSESAVITIEGMACQEGCADTISANLKKVSGVTAVEVSYATGQANINFNTNEVSIDVLKAVITNTKVKNYVYTIKEVVLVEYN
jgi:copper chaperone CopZ